MNNGNLKPFNALTESEHREIARKGGKASVEARKQRASMREVADMVLGLRAVYTESEADYYQRLGLKLNEITIQTKLLLKMVTKAMQGDVRAFECLRDMVGENPRDSMAASHEDANEDEGLPV